MHCKYTKCCQKVWKRSKKAKKRGPLAAPPSMFWVYLLNQGPYRISEHCSTIFITHIIILNTKNRGSLGVLGAKVHAKVGRIGFFLEKIFSVSVKLVWLLNYPLPAQQNCAVKI